MIERQLVAQRIKEKEIEDFVLTKLGVLSCSHIKMQRTPLGEKVVVYTARPGVIVGKKGANIKFLTKSLKEMYGLDNPQVEVAEIENAVLDATTIAKSLVAGLMRFGARRFKVMAYRSLQNVMKAGALGIEIVISGRGLPGERAKTWRFTAGYLKKSGDISETYVDKAIEASNLKSGTVGVKVSVLHPNVVLPDYIKVKEVGVSVVEKDGTLEEIKEKIEKKTKKKKKAKLVDDKEKGVQVKKKRKVKRDSVEDGNSKKEK